MSIEINSKLRHLSIEELEELINRYYNDEKVQDLIDYYKVDISPQRLYKLFPPIISHNNKCSRCGNYLVRNRNSKSAYTKYTNLYCAHCGHREDKSCSCKFCTKDKKDNEEERLKNIELENKNKKSIVYDVFNIENSRKVLIDDLNFKDRVYLGALLRTFLDEDAKKILSFKSDQFKFSPNFNYSIKILRYLVNKQIIIACPESGLEYFELNSDDSITYSLNEVNYNLNLDIHDNYEEVIFMLMNPEAEEYDKVDAVDLWKEIALEELLEILVYEMKKTRFDFNPGDKTILVFNDLLEKFSVGQIYSIIWKQIANASKWYQEGGVSKRYAANSVITNCQSFAERAINQGWELNNYYRPADCKQSMLSKFYFDRVLKIGELGFNMPPVDL